MNLPDKVDVVGTGISATSYAEVLEVLDHPPTGPAARTIAFCNVHSVIEARDDDELRVALQTCDLATPDGMPLVWALRRLGVPDQQRVYGPDLMEYALPHGVPRGWTHYFYGSTPETLQRLTAAAERMAPGINVVGTHSPPFRPLTDDELDAVVADIDASGAQLVWVGLGMPKQEKFIHQVRDRLPGRTLLAVGAAFAMHAGDLAQAPDWIQKRGLEWAYRLVQEPGRLWRRYAQTNPRFVLLMARQLLRRGFGRAGRTPTRRGPA